MELSRYSDIDSRLLRSTFLDFLRLLASIRQPQEVKRYAASRKEIS